VSTVEVVGLGKRWGASAAVDDVAFTIRSGEFAVLLGPSGCGKSTTLRLVAGLEAASTGRVLIDGEDVTQRPPKARALSMVFQSYALFPHLSVAENILFGLKVRRVAPAERRRRLDEAADLLGLGALLDRRPSQLSGGQQQRVALGRAIVAKTRLCLMDEPLSNLDAKLRAEMRREIRGLQRALGMTMLYVTHDQAEAMSMADRVILMNGGRIEQIGAPHELYERPRSVFAARFIGTPPMNVVADARSRRLLGIRPEDVAVTQDGDRTATVETVEYLGADSLVACRLGDEPLIVRVAGRSALAAGATLRLRLPDELCHRFDAATGQRLDAAPAAGAAAHDPQPARSTGPSEGSL